MRIWSGTPRNRKCTGLNQNLIKKYLGERGYMPWFAQGLYFASNLSVLQTEAIALEEAVKWFTNEINEHKTRG